MLEDIMYYFSYKWLRLKSTINSFFCAHTITTPSYLWDDEDKYCYPRCSKCGSKIKIRNRKQ